jgi:aryl-alcohol dehydrogenase-like predicted oxidoreductase
MEYAHRSVRMLVGVLNMRRSPMAQTRREFLEAAAAMGVMAAAGFVRAAAQPEAGQKAAALERRRFGGTDMEVTVLGFGGAEIGFQQTDQGIVDRLLNSALDAGLNVIDTAECYAGSEEAIGRAVSGRRKEYFLFTKVGHMEGRGPEGWTAPSIAKSIDRSLERLKTDRVDLVQLHSCGKSVLEKGECIEALEKAKKAGKTRYIGYSGDSEAAVYAVETGRFDALQISVSIADQEAVDLVLPKAREKNLGVIAKRPIANAVWRNADEPRGGNSAYWKRLSKLDYDFVKGARREDQGPQGAAGVALRFTLAVPGVDVAIVGTSKPERWKQNAELLRAGGPLPKEQYQAIRARWKEVAEAGWTGQT